MDTDENAGLAWVRQHCWTDIDCSKKNGVSLPVLQLGVKVAGRSCRRVRSGTAAI
jgi:hypothetical protein